jgi:DNA-directed RNA polymerase specialized sigma24 family protein
MANEQDVTALMKMKDDPKWSDVIRRAEDFAESLVISTEPYRKMTRDHPSWFDVVGEFVTTAMKSGSETASKEEEAVNARRYKEGSSAAGRFFYNQVRKRLEHEHDFSSGRATAFLGIPESFKDRDGDAPVNYADLVADDYVPPLDQMAKREMGDAIREAIDNLPMPQKLAVRMHGGLGVTLDLDGYEPRDPNKDGSGGARGLHNVEIAPSVGVGGRQVGNLLRQARSAILEALLERWTVQDVKEYYPNLLPGEKPCP